MKILFYQGENSDKGFSPICIKLKRKDREKCKRYQKTYYKQ